MRPSRRPGAMPKVLPLAVPGCEPGRDHEGMRGSDIVYGGRRGLCDRLWGSIFAMALRRGTAHLHEDGATIGSF